MLCRALTARSQRKGDLGVAYPMHKNVTPGRPRRRPFLAWLLDGLVAAVLWAFEGVMGLHDPLAGLTGSDPVRAFYHASLVRGRR
jgi:hypothetical protein